MTVATTLEELDLLREAEGIADAVWEMVKAWQSFERQTLGSQLVRSADSIGANIAESYGRYHFGDKIQFLYYARGSLFETKYWLRRCVQRTLIVQDQFTNDAQRLEDLARGINAFVKDLRRQQHLSPPAKTVVKEPDPVYSTTSPAISDLRSLISDL